MMVLILLLVTFSSMSISYRAMLEVNFSSDVSRLGISALTDDILSMK